MLDVLMVTYDAPESTALCLRALLESCDEYMRVWLWHNGNDERTLETVTALAEHPRVFRFHHSPENQKLWAPTNWLLEHADGEFLSKVDDDNLVPPGWAQKLITAHRDYEDFGVLGCWRFQEEDFLPEVASRKIRAFPGGHRLMLNLWVEGSCFVMKSVCRDALGGLAPGQSFPQYCRELAFRGWVNGYYYPFICYENLDDPRAPHSPIKSNEDLRRHLPLTAQYNGVDTVEAWVAQLRRSAHVAQTASIDPAHYRGWRKKLRGLRLRARRLLGRKNYW